jgi:cation transport protein ChaC
MSLTRADLESQRLKEIIAQSSIKPYILSEAQLQRSIDATLQNRSQDDVWIFAYGSLIWNPIIKHAEYRVGKIHGWHRRFCLWTPVGRGTLENPGLILGLERGGSCRGLVYRIAAADVATELLLLWRREMIAGAYIPRWVRVVDGKSTTRAIAFTINHKHPGYASNLSIEVVAKHVATAKGSLGSCADYLAHTVDGLTKHGIRDKKLLQICDRIVAND